MCSPLLSPLASAAGSGSRAGLAMLSPAAALVVGNRKKAKPAGYSTGLAPVGVNG